MSLSAATRRSRHPCGLELTFDPAINLFKFHNKSMPSISQLCYKMFPPPPPSASSSEISSRRQVAERIAAKELRTVDDVFAEWRSAQVLIRNVRAHVECLINNKPRPPMLKLHGDEEMYFPVVSEAVEKWVMRSGMKTNNLQQSAGGENGERNDNNDTYDHHPDDDIELVEADALVCSPAREVAGQIDFLCRNKRTGGFIAIDLRVTTSKISKLPSFSPPAHENVEEETTTTAAAAQTSALPPPWITMKQRREDGFLLAPLSHLPAWNQNTANRRLTKNALELLLCTHLLNTEGYSKFYNSNNSKKQEQQETRNTMTIEEHGIIEIGRLDLGAGSEYYRIDPEVFLLPPDAATGEVTSSQVLEECLGAMTKAAKEARGKKKRKRR